MLDILTQTQPTLAVLPLLPALALLFTGGAVAAGAVAANNATDQPSTVNHVSGNQSNSNSAQALTKFAPIALLAGIAYWVFGRKK